jgi:hypothetical protein
VAGLDIITREAAMLRLTLQDLEAAHQTFEAIEPRGLFYRAATELVASALRKDTSLTLAEALAVLLQTWNRTFYRFRGFDTQHFLDIESLITDHKVLLNCLRNQVIEELRADQRASVERLFGAFEVVLGPVSAAKSLHLLAPRLFPLWDVAIAKAYGFSLRRRGTNAERYWYFMLIAKEQCIGVGGEASLRRNPLKAIDEYNYSVVS